VILVKRREIQTLHCSKRFNFSNAYSAQDFIGLWITHQLFKSYVLYEWCVHSRLSNAYYEVKFKKTTDTYIIPKQN
jgi:hypothetical protein